MSLSTGSCNSSISSQPWREEISTSLERAMPASTSHTTHGRSTTLRLLQLFLSGNLELAWLVIHIQHLLPRESICGICQLLSTCLMRRTCPRFRLSLGSAKRSWPRVSQTQPTYAAVLWAILWKSLERLARMTREPTHMTRGSLATTGIPTSKSPSTTSRLSMKTIKPSTMPSM
jgi:hypothetical protein